MKIWCSKDKFVLSRHSVFLFSWSHQALCFLFFIKWGKRLGTAKSFPLFKFCFNPFLDQPCSESRLYSYYVYAYLNQWIQYEMVVVDSTLLWTSIRFYVIVINFVYGMLMTWGLSIIVGKDTYGMTLWTSFYIFISYSISFFSSFSCVWV